MSTANIPYPVITKGKALVSLYGIHPNVFNDEVSTVERPDDSKASKADGLKVASWGQNNLFPNELVQKMSKCSLGLSALKFRIDAHYGKGLFLYRESVSETNPEAILKVPLIGDEKWNNFKRNNQIEILQAGLISDWEWFRNIFGVQIILSNDGSTINRVFRRPAINCRWYKREGKKNISKICIRSSWEDSTSSDSEIVLDVLDIDDPIADLRNRIKVQKTKKRTFFLPFRLEEFGSIYYDVPYWQSIVDSWVKIAENVAKVKNALLSNQIMLKYHVKIPYSFWPSMYKDWDKMDQNSQLTKINEWLDQLDAFLADTDNYGKSFVSHFGRDSMTQQIIDEIKIDSIDNTKIKDGTNIVDGQAANAEILTALGVDPTLLGGLLPGGSQSGSGSNKREALYIHLAKLGIDTAATTFWVKHLFNYNGWGDIEATYKYMDTSQTLNQNPTGRKEVA